MEPHLLPVLPLHHCISAASRGRQTLSYGTLHRDQLHVRGIAKIHAQFLTTTRPNVHLLFHVEEPLKMPARDGRPALVVHLPTLPTFF